MKANFSEEVSSDRSLSLLSSKWEGFWPSSEMQGEIAEGLSL